MVIFSSEEHAKSQGSADALSIVEGIFESIKNDVLSFQYEKIIQAYEDFKYVLNNQKTSGNKEIQKEIDEFANSLIEINNLIENVDNYEEGYKAGVKEGIRSNLDERIAQLKSKTLKQTTLSSYNQEGRNKLIDQWIGEKLPLKAKKIENKLIHDNRYIYNIPEAYRRGEREKRFKLFTSIERTSDEIESWNKRENEIEANYSLMLEATTKSLSLKIDAWKVIQRKKFHLIAEVNDPKKTSEEVRELINYYKQEVKEIEDNLKVQIPARHDALKNKQQISIEDYEIVKAGIITREEAEKIFGSDYTKLTTYSNLLLSDKSYKVEDIFKIARNYYKDEPTKGLKELAEITHDKIFTLIKSELRTAIEKKKISFKDIEKNNLSRLNKSISFYNLSEIPLNTILNWTDHEIEFIDKVIEGKLKLEDITEDISKNALGYALLIIITKAEEWGHFAFDLINLGAELKVTDDRHNGLLHLAVKTRNLDLIKALLNKGADPNTFNGNNKTPLAIAALKGKLEICKLLVANKANINFPYWNYAKGPLYCAIERENEEICEFFLENGANLYDNSNLLTILSCAIAQGNSNIINKIIDRGVNVNTVEDDGATPLLAACLQEDVEVIKNLFNRGANDRLSLNSIVKMLLKKGNNTNYKEVLPIETSVLTWAVRNNKNEIVKVILENAKNLDINIKDGEGNTALILAIKNKNIEIVQELLVRGADHSVINNGVTPLLLACLLEDVELIKALLNKGAELKLPLERNIEMSFTKNNTNSNKLLTTNIEMLNWAVNKSKHEIVKVILENIKNNNFNIEDHFNLNFALFYAIKNHNPELCKILIENGANKECRDERFDDTPLTYALKAGNKAICEYLLSQNVDINAKDCFGHTALNCVIYSYYNQDEITTLLLEHGAKDGNFEFAEKAKFDELEQILLAQDSEGPSLFPSSQGFALPNALPSTSLSNSRAISAANTIMQDITMEEGSNKRSRNEEGDEQALSARAKMPRSNAYSR
jgi:ankyrin repeat protein